MSVQASGMPQLTFSGKDGKKEFETARAGQDVFLLDGRWEAFLSEGVLHVYKPQL